MHGELSGVSVVWQFFCFNWWAGSARTWVLKAWLDSKRNIAARTQPYVRVAFELYQLKTIHMKLFSIFFELIRKTIENVSFFWPFAQNSVEKNPNCFDLIYSRIRITFLRTQKSFIKQRRIKVCLFFSTEIP